MITSLRNTRFLALTLCSLALVACSSDDGDGDDGPAYAFSDLEASAYQRVDRIGMPAVGHVVIGDPMKEAYNLADPADTADFAGEIVARVEFLHGALDDDITGATLVPCVPANCVDQADELVIPDTLRIDLDQPSGFPNGRRLEDPVIDVTLALLLLDLTVEGQTVTSLVGVLNPSENDIPLLSEFPYLADPHT